MPYNPGSAYPRKTVYVPPTHGDHAFQRAVNAPDVSSQAAFGGVKRAANGRGLFAHQAGAASSAALAPDARTGMDAMNRQGIVGQLQSRYMEQRGLKQNQAGGVQKPEELKSPAERAASTHGNPAAMEKRAAAVQLADEMNDSVVTGDLPGFTGTANTRKSKKKKSDPNQETLF